MTDAAAIVCTFLASMTAMGLGHFAFRYFMARLPSIHELKNLERRVEEFETKTKAVLKYEHDQWRAEIDKLRSPMALSGLDAKGRYG